MDIGGGILNRGVHLRPVQRMLEEERSIVMMSMCQTLRTGLNQPRVPFDTATALIAPLLQRVSSMHSSHKMNFFLIHSHHVGVLSG